MSTRPAPRKSSLAGSSPVAPPAEPAPAQRTPEIEQPAPRPEPQPAAATPPEATAARSSSTSTKKATKYPPKVSFYQNREDTDRVRGAILHTMASEGARSLSQFIHQAVMEKVEALEAKYNGGRPFPPVGARELPQGRPMGE